MKTLSLVEKFLAKTEPELNSGCLLWSGYSNRDGHGVCGLYVHPAAAHRVAWRFFRGLITKGLSVLHHCDTPACVNVEHLFLGTQADNVADMVRKGRQNKANGADKNNAKLSWDQVEAIRQAEGFTQAKLARLYGINQSQISRIKTNKTYERRT